jgi:iron only hydrogenase large subunit-like protein
VIDRFERPDGVYHVTVMPCYDKKLEASRQDFYNDIYSTRDVDCVITTGELELIMLEHGWDLGKEVPGELDVHPGVDDVPLPELMQHTGSSSGSYLHSIITHLQCTSIAPLTLSVKMIRNSDYEEYTLSEDEGAGRVVFKGAKCFGFRNLQNIVRKVGKAHGVRTGSGAAGKLAGRRRVTKEMGSEDKAKNYDYVEVMACPGGCVNGGGQLKPRLAKTMTAATNEEAYGLNWEESGMMQNAKWGDREWTRLVEEAYWRTSALYDSADADILADRVLEELCGGDPDQRRDKLRTSYRAVESEVLGLAVKW